MKTLSLVLSVFLFAACGSSKDSSYSYELEQNGCKTGSQSFDSKDAYCAGLKDDRLNKNCAYSLRKSEFEQNCSGTF